MSTGTFKKLQRERADRNGVTVPGGEEAVGCERAVGYMAKLRATGLPGRKRQQLAVGVKSRQR